ncbi:MAG: hypothetical protein LUQ15_07540, partial [Methanothrix sp.]
MKPVLMALILGLLLLSSGCIQRQEGPEVKETEATEVWKADGIAGAGEYSRSMILQGSDRQGYSGG